MAAAISKVPLLLQPRTKAFFALWSIVSLFLFLYHGVPALRYHLFQPSSARPQYDFTEGLFDNGLLTAVGTTATATDGAATVAFTVPSLSSSSTREDRIADALRDRNVTVHLVLATQARDDVSWADRLRIPGAADLRIIRYVADAPDAPYRPPVLNKGREALMYMTYLHDLYDELPDVAILVHAEDYAWHAEPALGTSMRTMLSRFDLREVLDDNNDHETQDRKKQGRRARLVNSRASSGQSAMAGDRDSGFNTGRRGYANLRTSWLNACPDWINTTKTLEESVKQEEPYMREAFLANFGPLSFPGDDGIVLQQQEQEDVPEILAGTCCSQFAVSRSAVRSRPRAQYKRSMDFLATTSWSDYIAGRTWEHLWPYLFRGAARDCPVEWKALCRMYGVCFPGGAAEQAAWMDRWRERERLREPLEFWRELGHPVVAARARGRMRELGDWLRKGLAVAVRRGEVGWEGVGDVYEFQ
ncbi:Ornithine aminotransferase [Apiospora arundinis]|uniref:Ornithine aminotransferase n=1 Tax=Apiospora arundinis TaxID=335852 RepID=A0ABR2HZU6_9PEZI